MGTIAVNSPNTSARSIRGSIGSKDRIRSGSDWNHFSPIELVPSDPSACSRIQDRRSILLISRPGNWN